MTAAQLGVLGSLIGSVAALITGIVTLFLVFGARRQQALAEQTLQETKKQLQSQNISLLLSNIDKINDRFMEIGEEPPVLFGLTIPDQDKNRSTQKAVMTLHQFNLFYRALLFEEDIGHKTMKIFETWATSTLFPWIYPDQYALHTFKRLIDAKDLYSESFIALVNRLVSQYELARPA